MIQAMSANKPPHILDMATACLCCLTAESGTISVYAHDLKPPHMKILDKIRHSTGLQLDSSTYVEMTTWPDKICQECHIELTVAYRFHEKIATVEKLFMSPTGLPMDKQLEEQERLEQQRQNHLKQQHMQLRQQLERHHLRLPATLKIKRLEMEPVATATATESSYYRDIVEKEVEEEEKLDDEDLETERQAVPSATTLLPDEGMVLSLDDLDDETEPLKMGGEPLTDEEEEEQEQEDQEEDKLLSLSPWDNDQTPEHLYEIETPIMEEELPPPLTMPPPPPPPLPPPPAQATSNKLRKRTYRRVSPIVKQESGKVADSSDLDKDFQPDTTVMAASSKRRQSERSPKICDVCGNTYKYQHALNAHMRRHNNDRPYPCEVCQKAFISNVELRRHMRVHTGQKPYGCKYCERRFSDFGSSKKHERIHTGERPYVCEVCHKGFAYAHVLSVHRRTHTGKKQFQCTKCDKGFTKKSYLSAHMEQQHRGSGSGELSAEGEGDEGLESGFNAGAGQQRLRLPGRCSKQDTTTFSLDSVVLGEQNKVLEECIVTNDFMFNEEDDEDDDDDDGGAVVDENEQEAVEAAEDHESYPPQPDFDDDVDGYHQTVRSSDPIKELVGDLLDTEEFDDESKYLID